MKFCKHLQRVVEISNPEWAPYCTNYKMLKKLIKVLRSQDKGELRLESPSSLDSSTTSELYANQRRGTKTMEQHDELCNKGEARWTQNERIPTSDCVESMEKSPGEVAFFKLLHAEFKKATYFFGKAQEEFVIREERVRKGLEITTEPHTITVNGKWYLLAKSLHNLYKDLLLLETFAIMLYCSFSKILKKHDKVTGYNTQHAFMVKIVNNANFAKYPVILDMIDKCDKMYEQVLHRLLTEGNQGRDDDVSLFLHMIQRVHEQAEEAASVRGMSWQTKVAEIHSRQLEASTMTGNANRSENEQSRKLSPFLPLVVAADSNIKLGEKRSAPFCTVAGYEWDKRQKFT